MMRILSMLRVVPDGDGVSECRSHASQYVLNVHCERVRATEHAARGPFYLLERRHGLAEILERGAGVLASTASATASLYFLFRDAPAGARGPGRQGPRSVQKSAES